MWTHLHPYLEAELTQSSIERRARVGLWRALNLRRLVVMAGSGVSLPFGLPTWDELAILFVDETMRQLKQVADLGPRGHDSLEARRGRLQQLRALCQIADKDEPWWNCRLSKERAGELDDTQVVLELCEDILAGLPPDDARGRERGWLARRGLAVSLRRNAANLAAARLSALFKEAGAGDASDQGAALLKAMQGDLYNLAAQSNASMEATDLDADFDKKREKLRTCPERA